MSNPRKQRQSTSTPEPFDRTAIAQLLRLAGPRPDVPTETGDRVLEATHSEWRDVVGGRRRRRVALWAGIGIAAAATLAVVLTDPSPLAPIDSVDPVQVAELQNATGMILRASEDGEPQLLPVGASVFSSDRLETGPEARAALGMRSGGSLRLDTNTRIQMLGGRRLMLEQGSLYVDSGGTEMDAEPVEIHTQYGVVTDIGTQFQIRNSGDRLQVQVREGEVRLSRGRESHQVGVGVSLRLSATGELTRRTTALYGPEWDWILDVAPSFMLDESTLASFLTWISRETGWNLAFASDTLAASAPGVVLHGSIPGLRPDQALDAVLPTCGLSYRLSEGTLLIESEIR